MLLFLQNLDTLIPLLNLIKSLIQLLYATLTLFKFDSDFRVHKDIQ